MKNLYAALGVRPSATTEQIKSAYRQKARTQHPDAGGDRGLFEAATEAYETLSNPDKRAAYDAERETWAGMNGAVLCVSCGAALRMPRSPTADETVTCTGCRAPIPIDARHFVSLQKQRLINTAARALSSVSDEAVDTAADLARGLLRRVRHRARSKS